jgi:hypothetical protein
MLKTKKLTTLVKQELDGLKYTIPLIVLKSLRIPTVPYFELFGSLDAAYALYIKNKITTPYSYSTTNYIRCRAKIFKGYNFSALEYYINNSSVEKVNEIIDYLKGNIDKISL